MRPFGELLPLDEARRRVLDAARSVNAVEPVAVLAAVGRVAARTVRAPRPVPTFARATWDGYALSSSATRGAGPERPAVLRVVGEVYAERRFRGRVGPSEAVAIATGGELPRGADAVVPFERTRLRLNRHEVPVRVDPGDRVARPGDDFPRGARLVEAGARLGPADLGALAAAGIARVGVFRRPVVTIVPNGNELLAPGAALKAGRIYESNNATLAAVVGAEGGIPRARPPVPDDPARIERALRRALATSDLVLATGGSSVGEHDYLPAIFPKLGRLLFHGIAVRPGKPTLAAVTGGKLLLGLPGHPTSCLSNAYWLLLPLLRKLAHRPGPGWVDEPARLATALDAPSHGFASIVPVRLADGWAHPTFRDSSAISSLAGANGFAVRAVSDPALARGATLTVHRLDPALVGDAPPGGPKGYPKRGP